MSARVVILSAAKDDNADPGVMGTGGDRRGAARGGRIVGMRVSDLALVGGALLVVFAVGGLRLVFGVWVRPLEADFGVDRAAMGSIGALAFLVFGLGQPAFGRIVDVKGPGLVIPGSVLLAGLGVVLATLAPSFELFALAYVLVAGVGFSGLANATLAATVVQRFDRHHGLIFGVLSAGAPLGQLALAQVAAVGVEGYGWRWAMGALGALLLVVVLPIAWALLGRSPAPRKEPPPGLRETFGLAFRTRGFVLLFAAYFVCGVTTLGLVHTHVVPYGVDIGLADVAAAQMLGLLGLFNVASLLLGGRVADRWGGRRPLIGVFVIRSVALLWMATAVDEYTLGLSIVLFGLTDMATIPLAAAAATEMFGPRMLGVLMGFLVVAHQVGSALGSFVAGLGYELLGGYPPVIVAAVGMALGGALLCVAMDTRRALREGPTLAPSGV